MIGLFTLLLNDFYLKTIFGNWLTGKLSDLSGLFIFPLFLSVLFPKQNKTPFLLTGFIFILWKLPVADFLFSFFRDFGIPIGRTVDYTDFLALVMLPLAYYYMNSPYKSLKINPGLLAVISLFAFCATTISRKEKIKYSGINKIYHFDFSRQLLIQRLNSLSAKKIYRAPEIMAIHYNSEEDLFISKTFGDTVAVFLDEQQIKNNDTIHYATKMADFIIDGNDSTSTLKFLSIYRSTPYYSEKDYRKKVIKVFERRVIKKIK
ncbi:hypothetical protein ACE1ET_05635 [Saccharicrinis sp. FJH62]|uniref:hypothetical protein n=1 Tax=Saccharicrinis sp. FJH62 TaxID=3344657 RepID=UPI0035D4970D